ncbi:MAG: choice-of-anchor P family protein [Actinomycetota bacterium]
MLRGRKSLLAGAIALGACGLLAGASTAVAPGPADPSAKAVGAILPGGGVASATASPRNPTRTASAQPSGSVASGGTVSVRAAAGQRGAGQLAAATATADGVSLLGGRVVVGSMRLAVRSDTAGATTTAGVTEWAADITVLGQPVDEAPGAQVDIPGVGTMVMMERLVNGGAVTANGVRIEVSDPASGLAPGTQIVVGRVEATTGGAVPDSPSPDPGSAPSAPGAATPSADGVTSAPAQGSPLPTAPTAPATGGTTGAAGGATSGYAVPGAAAVAPTLGLPRRDPGAVMGVASTQGYAFPVLGEGVGYGDDYGDPRAGTGWHHGTDLFAPMGTPIVAVADGTLSKVGVNNLGGNRLWLTDDAGNEFYYAHLSAYAPGTADGVRVRAGQVIAFLGNTGQAITTPPHLHFEIHPGGGDSVNPYPYLVAWQRNAPVPQAFVAATQATGHVPAAGVLLLDAQPLEDSPGQASPDGVAVPVR